MVKFKQFNLVEENYSVAESELNNMDLILCNNVLIYFSPNQIAKVVKEFTDTLSKGGHLIVSAIEVPYIQESRLKAIRTENTTYFIKSAQSNTNMTSPALNISNETSTIKISKKVDPYPDTIKNEEIVLIARAYFHLKNESLALKWCKKALEQDKLNPLLYYLEALILQESNHLTEAIISLKRALYLDPEFILAYFSLGNLMLEQNNGKEANRLFRNTLDLLKQQDPNTILPGDETMTAQQLSELIQSLIHRK